MKAFLVLPFLAASALAALPSVGPDYKRPVVPAPPAYRDADASAPGAALTTEWWRLFGDPALDQLEARALLANQDLRVAVARVEQARALAGAARSQYYPALELDPAVDRERFSQNVRNAATQSPATVYSLPLNLGWELDLFGRVRRSNEAARAEFAAAGASYAAARLALAAEVATTHFTLRATSDELRIVTSTVDVRRSALKLAQARFNRGNAGELDVARAETELASTEADAAALAMQRAATQNALALLLGEAAPDFSVDVDIAPVTTPDVPAGLPSELLLRRPDVAAAECGLAAASARIGVAQAAFFPAISLTGSAGYASADVSDLFRPDSRFASIGPSIYLPIFQGGRNRANLERSRALYTEALASYRQYILAAFREVQDALTASRLLETQAAAEARAVESARRGARLSLTRYDAGYVSYLEVVDAQRTALDVERADARLAGQRWITRVTLIKALGGGWQAER